MCLFNNWVSYLIPLDLLLKNISLCCRTDENRLTKSSVELQVTNLLSEVKERGTTKCILKLKKHKGRRSNPVSLSSISTHLMGCQSIAGLPHLITFTGTYLYIWVLWKRHCAWECIVFPNNTTQLPRPGLRTARCGVQCTTILKANGPLTSN